MNDYTGKLYEEEIELVLKFKKKALIKPEIYVYMSNLFTDI